MIHAMKDDFQCKWAQIKLSSSLISLIICLCIHCFIYSSIHQISFLCICTVFINKNTNFKKIQFFFFFGQYCWVAPTNNNKLWRKKKKLHVDTNEWKKRGQKCEKSWYLEKGSKQGDFLIIMTFHQREQCCLNYMMQLKL